MPPSSRALRDAVPRQAQHLDDDGLGSAWPSGGVMLERRHDRLPRADVAEQAHAQLVSSAAGSWPSSPSAPVELAAGHGEGLGLEDAQPGAVVGCRIAVLAAAAASRAPARASRAKRARSNSRSTTDGHPPAGDVVAPQLEEAAGHGYTPPPRAPDGAGAVLLGRLRDRRRESRAEGLGEPVAGLLPRRAVEGSAVRAAPAQLPGDRGDVEPGHAAGVDELEVLQAGGDVERDAVVGDAPLDAQAEGTQLARQRARPRSIQTPG